MILNVNNFTTNNSLSFGNTRSASKTFKELTKASAELYDRINKKSYKRKGVTMLVHNKQLYFPASDITLSKTFDEGNKIVTLNVDKKYGSHYFDFSVEENGISDYCTFLMNKNGTLEDKGLLSPITKKMNKAFETYVPQLLEPFKNFMK